jgi:cyclophilin family peptidyl-prolyl cis-trans isomerase
VSKAEKRERQKENRERAREERERLLRRQKQMKTFRSLLIVLVPIMVILIVVSLTTGGSDSKSKTVDPSKTYTATIDTSQGTMVIALDAKKAPKATSAFVTWADDKKYDGLCIDRIARDFVIQGGSPNCTQAGDLGTPVQGEVPTDHYPIGVLAGAKGGADPPGTFGGQFFIVTGSQGATLPNDYARFGTVTSGLDVAQKIGALPIKGGAQDGPPAQKITIKKITIKVTKGSATTTTSVPATSTTAATPPSS